MNENAADLLLRVADGVAHLTLNRPLARNALSRALLARLGKTLDEIAADESVHVVVLAAEGPAFCSGHDLNELAEATGETLEEIFAECSAVMLKLRRLPQPVIARVQGPAVAAGCQLVAACDLAVAAQGATFSTPGVKIGLFCTTPMVPLVRVVAPRAALEMLLTGAPITAARALELGLVNRVVTPDRLDESVGELTDAIMSSSPAVIRLGKAAFYEQRGREEATAYERACALMRFNAEQPEAREGIAAFLAKRAPRWSQTSFGPAPGDA
jgi:enoyl-CoA hydratase/carnithine racemase